MYEHSTGYKPPPFTPGEPGFNINDILITETEQKILDFNPCIDVICEDECFGNDLYNQVCSDGICVKGILIDDNATQCGYIPPDPQVEEIQSEIDYADELVVYTEVPKPTIDSEIVSGDPTADKIPKDMIILTGIIIIAITFAWVIK